MNIAEAVKLLDQKQFDNVSVDSCGFGTEIYISIPRKFRIWLKDDGTYKMDVGVPAVPLHS